MKGWEVERLISEERALSDLRSKLCPTLTVARHAVRVDGSTAPTLGTDDVRPVVPRHAVKRPL